MTNKIKLLLVDDNPEVTNSIKHCFLCKNNFEVIGVAQDAIEAIKLLELDIPDIIIMDLIMPNADGFYLLEYIRNKLYTKSPKIIILSCLSQESVISQASMLGADYYIVKPFSLEVLYNRVIEICKKQYSISNKTIDDSKLNSIRERISEIFALLGVPLNTKGCKYLFDCILASLREPSKIGNLSQEIYPSVGFTYGTNIYNVERAIRYTIDLTWINLEDIIAKQFDLNKNIKPSNKYFINKMVQQLISEGY